MLQVFPYEMSGHLQVSGEDAADFLQSQFSNELRPIESGRAVYGLWLDVKGRVVADSWVCCTGTESFEVYSEHCPGAGIAEKLEQHIIADEVEIEVLPPVPAVALIGQQALASAEASAEASEENCDLVARLPGRRSIEPSVECVFATAEAREAFLQNRELDYVSAEQIQKMRLSAAFPLVPLEIGPTELPGEGGLDQDAVAFDKGCFLGQEVVARMRNVGRATRGLYRVRGAGPPPDCPQKLALEDGKAIGELRTAYADGIAWQGVALLKLRHALPSQQLTTESGMVEIVSEFKRLNPLQDNE